jgi:RNA polymerase-binding transcription factor DksA
MRDFSAEEMRALRERLAIMKREALEEIDRAHADIDAGRKAPNKDVGSFSDEVEAGRLGEVRLAEINIDRNTLRLIEEAERSLDEGRYGVCVDCGEPIARERLLALPTAMRCAACQQKYESRLRR